MKTLYKILGPVAVYLALAGGCNSIMTPRDYNPNPITRTQDSKETSYIELSEDTKIETPTNVKEENLDSKLENTSDFKEDEEINENLKKIANDLDESEKDLKNLSKDLEKKVENSDIGVYKGIIETGKYVVAISVLAAAIVGLGYLLKKPKKI